MRTILAAAVFVAGLSTLIALPACETGGSALDRPATQDQPRGRLDSVTTPDYARPTPSAMPH
jgi:hypothetical protein